MLNDPDTALFRSVVFKSLFRWKRICPIDRVNAFVQKVRFPPSLIRSFKAGAQTTRRWIRPNTDHQLLRKPLILLFAQVIARDIILMIER